MSSYWVSSAMFVASKRTSTLSNRGQCLARGAIPQRVNDGGSCVPPFMIKVRKQGHELLLHAICDARVRRHPAQEFNVSLEATSDVQAALKDQVVRHLVGAHCHKLKEGQLEERVGRAEAVADLV